MIRNYYTDSFKEGRVVTASDTLLIDGKPQASTPQSVWKEYNLYVGTSPAASTISVLTSSNQELTFVNPAAGFVLPVSVVQVTAVAGGLTGIIALE